MVDSSCIYKIQNRVVRGNSLSGIVENGDSLKIYFGYYLCNRVLRDDIAVYQYAGSEIPLVKVVKAIPGDSFSIVCNDGRCSIRVNGSFVKNKNGSAYFIAERSSSLLKYYCESYKSIVPEKTFMILGNHDGTTDSGKFGLVGINDLIGKAEIRNSLTPK